MSSEPVDQLNDNVIGDLTDSMATGIFAHLLMSVLFNKNPSIKSVLSMENLKTGVKTGGAVALYRRVGRPMLNKAMNGAGMGEVLRL